MWHSLAVFPVSPPVTLCHPCVTHHGGEQHGKHLELCLPGGGVCRCGVARKPLPAFTETCLGLHARKLHQIPDCHLGVSHRPWVHLLPVLPARVPVPVHALHAEIQDPTGAWCVLVGLVSFTQWTLLLIDLLSVRGFVCAGQTRDLGEAMEMFQGSAVQPFLYPAASDLWNLLLYWVLQHPIWLGLHATLVSWTAKKTSHSKCLRLRDSPN